MILEIILQKDKQVKLFLIKEKKETATLVWMEKDNLSRALLKNIDNFLKQEKINLANLKHINIRSEIENHFTIVRITHSVVNSLKFCLNNYK